MRYLRQILLKNERVLFSGKLHAILYARGAILLLVALWLAYLSTIAGLRGSIVLGSAYTLLLIFPQFPVIWEKAVSFYGMLPSGGIDLEMLAIILALVAIYLLIAAFILIHFTELLVTDRRIIAKTGVFNVTTVEFDRDRLAGVTVHQTVLGRVLDYGWVILEGFSGDIGGLPPIAHPHELQKAVNSWRGDDGIL